MVEVFLLIVWPILLDMTWFQISLEANFEERNRQPTWMFIGGERTPKVPARTASLQLLSVKVDVMSRHLPKLLYNCS